VGCVLALITFSSCSSPKGPAIALPSSLLGGERVYMGEDFVSVRAKRQLHEDSSTGLWVEQSMNDVEMSQATYDFKGGKLSYFGYYARFGDSVNAVEGLTKVFQAFSHEYGAHIIVDDSLLGRIIPKMTWKTASDFVVDLSYSTVKQRTGDSSCVNNYIVSAEYRQSAGAIVPSKRFSRLGIGPY
jgi:hypothetical protein